MDTTSKSKPTAAPENSSAETPAQPVAPPTAPSSTATKKLTPNFRDVTGSVAGFQIIGAAHYKASQKPKP
jgi:hypothetical protein